MRDRHLGVEVAGRGELCFNRGMTNLHKRLVVSAILLTVVGAVALVLAVDGGPTVRLSTASAGSGPCMFDPSERTYRNCAHASMGQCHHYTTT